MSHPWLRLTELAGTRRPESGNTEVRQWRWLQSCLARNAVTEYGRRHHFDRICSVHEFRRSVPLGTYKELQPWLTRVADGESDVLFAGRAVAFERTSGSSAASKLIPYSSESLQDLRQAVLPWLAQLVSDFDMTEGCAYWAISPALRAAETTRGGIPVGLPDGAYLGNDVLPIFSQLSAVPPWVGALEDISHWQLATLYWLLVRADLVLISVWSPTFFLQLLVALTQRRDELRFLLRAGGKINSHHLPADAGARTRLEEFIASGDTRELWPRLRVVSAWADGASRPYYQQLARRLPHAFFQSKGLLSTEGITTVPDALHQPRLAIDSGFFEFMDSAGDVYGVQELVAGARYELVMTTAGGLYRYHTGDVVKVADVPGDVPVLHFAGRAGLSCDLVGEKLTEDFVCNCLQEINGFRMLVPSDDDLPGYILVVGRQTGNTDAIAEYIEQRLTANPQYAYARRLGQLRALRVLELEDPLAAYTRHMTGKGVPPATLKVPALHPESDWLPVHHGQIACASY